MARRGSAAPHGGFGRRRLISHAWIKVPGFRAVPCAVINRTANKALITFSGEAPAAHEFKLLIEGGDSEIHCEVYYRKPMLLGVRFVER